MAIRRFCNHVGCGELVDSGYCAKHQPVDIYKPRTREESHEHYLIYDANWSKVRNQKMHLNPLCEDCLPDTLTPAQEVHHIKKAKDYPALRLQLDNLMSLCKTCHRRRTAKGE